MRYGMKEPHEAEPTERWAPFPNKQILALCMARRLGLFGDDDGAANGDVLNRPRDMAAAQGPHFQLEESSSSSTRLTLFRSLNSRPLQERTATVLPSFPIFSTKPKSTIIRLPLRQKFNDVRVPGGYRDFGQGIRQCCAGH